ncbi:MAG: anti-sigma factor antagonist [Solirubrobacteraceae bacterium]|jgi:anti-anti-sigma factor|nr:anti-sigma factor antagonist [Solirubrobacteraceae bacterium]MEA2302412.1 anti-sigma factor antagonist [Solirubrobacteraceae bacterium]
MHFEIQVEERDDAVRIRVLGDLDLASVPALERTLTDVEATDAKALVLDLDGLDFIDSTGLRAVIEADMRSRADGGRMTITRGSPQVQRLFELVGADRRLRFAST